MPTPQPPYYELSNGNYITFKSVGMGKTIGTLLDSDLNILFQRDPSISNLDIIADEIINGYYISQTIPTIINKVLPTPKETPEQIQQRRQEKAAQRDKENIELVREQQNLKVVEQSVPENQKAKGSAKFGQLILKLGLLNIDYNSNLFSSLLIKIQEDSKSLHITN